MENNSYDNIANLYKDSKQLEFRKCVEEFTLLHIGGNMEGLSIIDLACGEGIYTRKLKKLGASDILGVDLSAAMIALAEESEAQESIGCKYAVHDVLTFQSNTLYDLAVGMYLLNYASSRIELLQFCKVAYSLLKPGGRFIGFNDNPMNDPNNYGNYKKYGFVKETPSDREEGDPIKYTIINPNGIQFQFNNFYLHPSTYIACMLEAGFSHFTWEGPFLQPDRPSNSTQDFWEDFMSDPPMIGFSALK